MGLQCVNALAGVDLEVDKGEFLSIMGHSGSGKSTLMNIIGMLDVPTSGNYFFENENVARFNEDKLTAIRRRKIGFVFQQYNLLPRMNAVKQVMAPLMYQGVPRKEREERAIKALELVGLKDRIKSKPNELSGGQQQRVSIARAIVASPDIILADEPTGALDSRTGEEIMGIFKKLNDKGHTIIIITHEDNIAALTKRNIRIKDGLLL